MNVNQNNIDAVNATLLVTVGNADYAEKVNKAIKDFCKKANMPGFRKGCVPAGLVKKMYGKGLLAEEVNKLVSEALYNYIKENNLNILGEPLPTEDFAAPSLVEGEDFTFSFDIALAPELNFTLSKDDKIVSYEVEVSEESKKTYKSNMLKQYGKLENTDEIHEDDFIIADLEQEGMKIEGTYITLRTIEDKGLFLGKKPGESFEIDVNKTFTNETDRAAMLKVKKEELADLNPMFTVNGKK